jgi:hypothetical protein
VKVNNSFVNFLLLLFHSSVQIPHVLGLFAHRSFPMHPTFLSESQTSVVQAVSPWNKFSINCERHFMHLFLVLLYFFFYVPSTLLFLFIIIKWSSENYIKLSLLFFYYSYLHARLGSFLPPALTPSLTTHSAHSLSFSPPQYPAETILPLFLILL